MTWVQTRSGREVDLLDPKPEQIDLGDIVWSLGHQCRYAGHTSRHYSVAEHSYAISRWLRDQGHPPPVQLAGLLHDAHEAYLGDRPSPVGWALAEEVRSRVGYVLPEVDPGKAARLVEDAWCEIKRRLDVAILESLGLTGHVDLHHPAVCEADIRILLDERDALLGPPPRPWGVEHLGPSGVEIDPASYTTAIDAATAWGLAADRLIAAVRP